MNSSKDAVVFNNTTTKNPLQDEGISVQEFSENYMIVIRYINLFFCCTAVLGNSSILLTIWKTSSLHSVSNILLSSLAVSDLSIGLVVQPIFVAHLENLATTDGLLYFNILGSVSCTVSFYSVTAIAVDRLLAVQLHLRYEAEVTPFRATVVVIIIWIYAALFSVFWLLNFYLVFKMISIVIMCILIGNFAVHLKIYLIVLRHQRQIQRQLQLQQQAANNENILRVKRFVRSAVNIFLLYILLLSCYMPFAVYHQLIFVNRGYAASNVYITTMTLVFLNSSLNPLFYSWRDGEIRTALKQFYGRCF